jgi:hypothetical protein
VELPEDDPDVLECFLQFLYTGTYKDETRPDGTGPAEASMMSPGEVDEELKEAPGVHVTAPASGQAGGGILSRRDSASTAVEGAEGY